VRFLKAWISRRDEHHPTSISSSKFEFKITQPHRACPGVHDDVANVVAGVAHCAVNRHTVKMTELRR
jgi:hypothetical protein